MAKDDAEYQDILRQIKRDERRERAQERKRDDVLKAMVFAFTGPANVRYVDGPVHRKRYEKALASLGMKP